MEEFFRNKNCENKLITIALVFEEEGVRVIWATGERSDCIKQQFFNEMACE